jgi:ketosteroid isomerase-like protein
VLLASAPVEGDPSTDLTATVRELADRHAIADLIHAYCEHFDANEPEAVAALFTEDAIVDYGPEVPTIVGGAQIAPAIAVGVERTFAATSHHVSNVRIELDGANTASSVSYLYAWHRYVDGSPDGELWGRYRHTFRRTEAGWRIASLRLEAAGTVDFHRSTMHLVGRRPAAGG